MAYHYQAGHEKVNIEGICGNTPIRDIAIVQFLQADEPDSKPRDVTGDVVAALEPGPLEFHKHAVVVA